MSTREQLAEEARIGRLLGTSPIDEKELSHKINLCPEWLKSFIHDLESRCDPAGEVRDLWCHKHAAAALSRKIEELEDALENAHGGQNTGDIEYCSARLEEARKERDALPLKALKDAFDFVHIEMGCYVQKDSCVNYPAKRWCVIDVDGEVVSRGETPLSAMLDAQRVVENV